MLILNEIDQEFTSKMLNTAMHSYPEHSDVLPQHSRIVKVSDAGDPMYLHPIGTTGSVLGAIDVLLIKEGALPTAIAEDIKRCSRNRFFYFVHFDGDGPKEITMLRGEKIDAYDPIKI